MEGLMSDAGLDLHEDLELPTIQELFVYYDGVYFDNTLGACTVEWSPQKMTRYVPTLHSHTCVSKA